MMLPIAIVVHEARIDKVQSSQMDVKNRVYHAEIVVSGRQGWGAESEAFNAECARGLTPAPFVNSLSLRLRLPTTALMPSPAQRVRVTVEFLPPEEVGA